MFEIATRKKFRFPYKGTVSVEDLWDLSVRELDGIFKTLNAKVKQANEESLLTVRSTADTDMQTMIDIVKHIVDVKLAEQAARELAADKRAKKQRIMEIMSQKQDADLQNKSMDELESLLKEMGD